MDWCSLCGNLLPGVTDSMQLFKIPGKTSSVSTEINSCYNRLKGIYISGPDITILFLLNIWAQYYTPAHLSSFCPFGRIFRGKNQICSCKQWKYWRINFKAVKLDLFEQLKKKNSKYTLCHIRSFTEIYFQSQQPFRLVCMPQLRR